MVTIRPLRKSDLPAYGALCNYCFGGMTADSTAAYMNWVGRSLAHSWGAFEDGRICAGMWYYPYQMRVGDRHLPWGGSGRDGGGESRRGAGAQADAQGP